VARLRFAHLARFNTQRQIRGRSPSVGDQPTPDANTLVRPRARKDVPGEMNICEPASRGLQPTHAQGELRLVLSGQATDLARSPIGEELTLNPIDQTIRTRVHIDLHSELVCPLIARRRILALQPLRCCRHGAQGIRATLGVRSFGPRPHAQSIASTIASTRRDANHCCHFGCRSSPPGLTGPHP
jgi:hypothetical protein